MSSLKSPGRPRAGAGDEKRIFAKAGCAAGGAVRGAGGGSAEQHGEWKICNRKARGPYALFAGDRSGPAHAAYCPLCRIPPPGGGFDGPGLWEPVSARLRIDREGFLRAAAGEVPGWKYMQRIAPYVAYRRLPSPHRYLGVLHSQGRQLIGHRTVILEYAHSVAPHHQQ